MANRPTNPIDLVSLPAVDASGALALGRAVLNTMARAKHVPKAVADSVSAIQTQVTALALVVRPKPTAARVSVRDADQAEDNAFAALIDFLDAFKRLPEETPERVTALKIRGHLVGKDGLNFLKAKPQLEWSEIQSRLDTIEHEHLAADLKSLGGEVFLKHLREVHAVYGVATGMTAPLVADETALVRGPRDALLAALKLFYVRVAASVEPDDADSIARAEQWLQPITDWEVNRDTGSAASEDPAPAPEPADPVAPADPAKPVDPAKPR